MAHACSGPCLLFGNIDVSKCLLFGNMDVSKLWKALLYKTYTWLHYREIFRCHHNSFPLFKFMSLAALLASIGGFHFSWHRPRLPARSHVNVVAIVWDTSRLLSTSIPQVFFCVPRQHCSWGKWARNSAGLLDVMSQENTHSSPLAPESNLVNKEN